MYNYVSILALLFMGFILFKQQYKRAHVKLLLGALNLDMILVIFMELNRNSNENLDNSSISNILLLHFIISSLVVVVYFYTLIFGVRLITANRSRNHYHVGVYAYVICRFMSYYTSNLIL